MGCIKGGKDMKKISKQEQHRRYIQSLRSRGGKLIDSSTYLSPIKGGFKVSTYSKKR